MSPRILRFMTRWQRVVSFEGGKVAQGNRWIETWKVLSVDVNSDSPFLFSPVQNILIILNKLSRQNMFTTIAE
jgi:hypothetical protein